MKDCIITQNLKALKVQEEHQRNKSTIIEQLVNKYPIDSVEDGMAEGDWDGWKMLTDRIGKKMPDCG